MSGNVETQRSIRMGEMSVARDGRRLTTLVGSCIGLALFDRHHRIGGVAHIVLPASRDDTEHPGRFVDTAIPSLLAQMEHHLEGTVRVVAKMAGGAQMFAGQRSDSVGVQNIAACEQMLNQLRIPIVARHCGGRQGRKMSLDTATGMVTIRIVGQGPIEL